MYEFKVPVPIVNETSLLDKVPEEELFNVTVLNKVCQFAADVVPMKYNIPLTASKFAVIPEGRDPVYANKSPDSKSVDICT